MVLIIKEWWWKLTGLLLIGYTVFAGILRPVPRLDIVNETIRNLYYHVPMWFTMVALFAGGAWFSIMHLRTQNLKDDIKASALTNVGILFSLLGMATGMEWANFTWGSPWSNDPKQLTTALSMLIYFAYVILRQGINDEETRGRISAVYNVFAFALMIPLLFIIPRSVASLHPGNGGNPAFAKYDLDSDMRMVFYPAVAGWIFMGVWISTLAIRLRTLKLEATEEQ